LSVELKSKTLSHLRKVCGSYGVVPTSYALTGVTRDGTVPQKASISTEIWKGTYETKPVAIKILKIPEGRKDYDKIKTVRQVFPDAKRYSHPSPLEDAGGDYR